MIPASLCHTHSICTYNSLSPSPLLLCHVRDAKRPPDWDGPIKIGIGLRVNSPLRNTVACASYPWVSVHRVFPSEEHRSPSLRLGRRRRLGRRCKACQDGRRRRWCRRRRGGRGRGLDSLGAEPDLGQPEPGLHPLFDDGGLVLVFSHPPDDLSNVEPLVVDLFLGEPLGQVGQLGPKKLAKVLQHRHNSLTLL